ncbi:MAG: tetratricopeptide repeat protein [Candidatus Eisenbacteria bacterium]|nr:tetratricopeptide repeat protein [Candidatus Eisenbacteria bacterium]
MYKRQLLTGGARELAIVAGLAILLYVNLLGNALVFDDAELIRKNEALHRPFDLEAIFGERYWGSVVENDTLYRPLTSLTFAWNYGLNRALGLPGDAPAGYHAANVLLHGIVSGLVLLLLRRAGMRHGGALAGALLFASLPIHTEAVASVVGRADLLAALFGIVFLLAHRGRWRLAAAPAALLLALFSKESAVAFAVVALWGDLLLGAPDRGLARYASYAAAIALWLAVRTAVVHGTTMKILPLDNPLVTAAAADRIATAGAVQLRYLLLELLPVRLSSDYSLAQIPLARPFAPAFLGFVVVLAAAAFAVWRLRRSAPLGAFAIGAYAILFLPVSNFLVTIGTILGERLAYAPSIFLCAILGLLAVALEIRIGKRGTVALVATILVLFAGRTVARNSTWKSEDSFYRTQIATAPNSAKANFNFARLLQEQGKSGEAIERYRRAVAIWPNYVDAWNNLGAVLKDSGRFDEAVPALRRAAQIQPSYPRPYFNLGQIYHLRGDFDAAMEMYRIAARLNPRNAAILSNMAAIHFDRGEWDEAEALWRQALAIDPAYENARRNLQQLQDERKRTARP